MRMYAVSVFITGWSIPLMTAQADAPSSVRYSDQDGVVRIWNEWVEVHIEPLRGMYVRKAVDRTTGEEITTELKLNYPYFEHGISREQPSGYRIVREEDGAVALYCNMRFGHHKTEKDVRRYGKFGDRSLSQLVRVRPNSAAFEFGGRVDNPTPLRMSSRLWDRAVMPAEAGDRFLMPASHGVEHSADWILAWPVREVKWPDGSRTTRDFQRVENWISEQGIRFPTQYFALKQVWPFSGIYRGKDDLNLLRIHDPVHDPGVKLYYARNFFELWGGTTPIFEDPGHFKPGFVSTEFQKSFYLVQGIGEVQYANDRVALHVSTGKKPVVHVASPHVLKNVTVVVGLPRLDERGSPELHPLEQARGDLKPGTRITVNLPSSRASFVVAVYDETGTLLNNDMAIREMGLPEALQNEMRGEGLTVEDEKLTQVDGVLFPLLIPDTRGEYAAAKAACSRGRPHWIEFQEHSNHRGIENTLSAIGKAKQLLKNQSVSVERMVSVANACYRVGDFTKASALAERVLTLEPGHPHAHHVLAMILYEQGKHDADRMEDHLQKAGIQANYIRAVLALEQGDVKTASRLLEVMTASPEYEKALRPRLLLASLWGREAETQEEAFALAKRITEENPAYPESFLVLMEVAEAASQPEAARSAEQALKALTEKNPDAPRQVALFREELQGHGWRYPARYRDPLPQPAGGVQ